MFGKLDASETRWGRGTEATRVRRGTATRIDPAANASDERDQEPHCYQSIETDDRCPEANVGHDSFDRDSELPVRHGASPRDYPAQHGYMTRHTRNSFRRHSRTRAQSACNPLRWNRFSSASHHLADARAVPPWHRMDGRFQPVDSCNSNCPPAVPWSSGQRGEARFISNSYLSGRPQPDRLRRCWPRHCSRSSLPA